MCVHVYFPLLRNFIMSLYELIHVHSILFMRTKYFVIFTDLEERELCAFIILVKILGKKEPKTKEEPLIFAFEKCKVCM